MTAPPIAPSEPAAVVPEDGLAAAHREMLADPSLQFQFHEFTPPDPPTWLEPLLRALAGLAPIVSYIFWGGVALTVLVILYLLGSEILRRLPDRARDDAPAAEPKPEYRPAPARARALLEEADRLAAQGRYSEAVRVLLHRSIEDLERMFALMIGPGLTSREIAALEPLSAQGRDVFGGLARAVEMSLFGGRDLDAGAFARCRETYASFALQGARP